MSGRTLAGLVAVVGAALLTLLLPVAMTDAELTVYVYIGLYALVVIGLSLLMGFAGQVSLGQGSFFAIGAYGAALLTMRWSFPPLLSLAVACAGTGALAALVGLPLLRLRGHYLAFATLAFQLIVLSVIGQFQGLTGGDTGLIGIPTLSLGPIALIGRYRVFTFSYVVWVLVAIALALSWNLIHSRPGRALRALATSEAGALASGIDVGGYKLRVFAFSAALAGLGGGVFAFFVGYIAPETFPILLSVEFLLMAAVGGMGSIFGAIAGTVLIYLLLQGLQALGTLPGMPLHAPVVFSYAVYALTLILILLLLPEGIVPAIGKLIGALVDRRRQASGEVQPGPRG
ncbi:MAG: branched-chain amino acid ABC transporter permease [Candidatus Dormibacteraeota bacterium]|nr:branched-chain amino acid ABC transporter permease [Candidatus Dormibacteraeota bacterium]